MYYLFFFLLTSLTAIHSFDITLERICDPSHVRGLSAATVYHADISAFPKKIDDMWAEFDTKVKSIIHAPRRFKDPIEELKKTASHRGHHRQIAAIYILTESEKLKTTYIDTYSEFSSADKHSFALTGYGDEVLRMIGSLGDYVRAQLMEIQNNPLENRAYNDLAAELLKILPAT